MSSEFIDLADDVHTMIQRQSADGGRPPLACLGDANQGAINHLHDLLGGRATDVHAACLKDQEYLQWSGLPITRYNAAWEFLMSMPTVSDVQGMNLLASSAVQQPGCCSDGRAAPCMTAHTWQSAAAACQRRTWSPTQPGPGAELNVHGLCR